MPVITQLLTDSEHSLLRSILPEESFFKLGNPYAITLLQRDIDSQAPEAAPTAVQTQRRKRLKPGQDG